MLTLVALYTTAVFEIDWKVSNIWNNFQGHSRSSTTVLFTLEMIQFVIKVNNAEIKYNVRKLLNFLVKLQVLTVRTLSSYMRNGRLAYYIYIYLYFTINGSRTRGKANK